MSKFRLVVLLSITLLVPSVSHAALLDGHFTIVGRGDVRVGPDFIDWGQVGNIFGTPIGDIFFVSGTGSFAGLALTNGEIKDLNQAMQPVGVPFTLDNFITTAVQPTWNFRLEFIFPGAGTAAGCTNNPGDVCTPFPNSPFTIVNLVGGGSSVGLSLRGTLTDGSGDLPSDFVGAFTTQFADRTAAQLLADLARDGFIQSSQSAEFTATVIPEPATMMLLGTGLLAFAAARRRRRG